MRRILFASVILFAAIGLLPVTSLAAGPVRGPQKCELAWTAPTTNTDNTPLTDLKSYNLYISPTKGQFATVFSNIAVATPAPAPNTTVIYDCRAVGLSDGQKWYTVKAVDLAGNPSANGTPDVSAVADGATQVDGIPFVFDAVPSSGATGLRISP